jgi:hypothetical protein
VPTTIKKQQRKRPRAPRATQRPDAVAFTVEGFQAIGGPGKTTVYALGKAGILKIYKDAIGRTLITGDSARAYLGLPPSPLDVEEAA